MAKHPGFDKVSNNIAKEYEKKGMSKKKAEEIGDATAVKIARNASPAAKKANPNLKHVKGEKMMKDMKCAKKGVKCAKKNVKCTKKVKCVSKKK